MIKRQDYIAGGLVSAAPGDANWFHGHFATSKEPLRVIAFLGGFPHKTEGAPGEERISRNVDIKLGGNTIEYEDEDPRIRETFKDELAKSGAPFNMPDEAYAPTPTPHVRVYLQPASPCPAASRGNGGLSSARPSPGSAPAPCRLPPAGRS